jgi:hypothetical protein
MEQKDHNKQEEKPGLPKTPQTPDVNEDIKASQPDKEHSVPSEKKIDLSDEDEALDSGI